MKIGYQLSTREEVKLLPSLNISKYRSGERNGHDFKVNFRRKLVSLRLGAIQTRRRNILNCGDQKPLNYLSQDVIAINKE